MASRTYFQRAYAQTIMNRIIRSIKKKTRSRYRDPLVEPDEIFLDAENLPDFDTQQFEGTIESPIGRRALAGVGIFFIVVVLLFSGRLWSLQIVHGALYTKQSQQNSLNREPIFAPRGNIYDKNGVLLAWNNTKTD